MNIISCNNIVKKFGTYTALNSVSLDIPQGQIFGLLGPNGAGKTTLIRIINQITIPDSGTLNFKGKPIHPDAVYEIGYLPEERGLYKKMKVGDQAMYFARLKGMSSQQAKKELMIWFKKFKIESWWDKKVEELSKGMAQKVQFITTVLHKPKLLILDEPFSGFDPVNAQLIRNEILALKEQGSTIILSTHNMESVEELCDNIALIHKSNLVVTGSVDKIRREHGDNKIEVIFKGHANFSNSELFTLEKQYDKNDLGEVRAILSLSEGAENKQVLSELINQVDDIISFRNLIPSMKDIFIKLVEENI